MTAADVATDDVVMLVASTKGGAWWAPPIRVNEGRMGRATIARSVRAPTRGDVRGLSRNGAGSSAKPSSRSVVGGAAPGVSWSKVHEPAGRWPLAMAKARVKASIRSVARVHAWTQSSNRSAVRNSSKASNAAARCRALSASGGGGHSRTVAAAWATRSRAMSTDGAAFSRLPVSWTESPAAPASSDICSIAAYNSSNAGIFLSAQSPVGFVTLPVCGRATTAPGQPPSPARRPSTARPELPTRWTSLTPQREVAVAVNDRLSGRGFRRDGGHRAAMGECW